MALVVPAFQVELTDFLKNLFTIDGKEILLQVEV